MGFASEWLSSVWCYGGRHNSNERALFLIGIMGQAQNECRITPRFSHHQSKIFLDKAD